MQGNLCAALFLTISVDGERQTTDLALQGPPRHHLQQPPGPPLTQERVAISSDSTRACTGSEADASCFHRFKRAAENARSGAVPEPSATHPTSSAKTSRPGPLPTGHPPGWRPRWRTSRVQHQHLAIALQPERVVLALQTHPPHPGQDFAGGAGQPGQVREADRHPPERRHQLPAGPALPRQQRTERPADGFRQDPTGVKDSAVEPANGMASGRGGEIAYPRPGSASRACRNASRPSTARVALRPQRHQAGQIVPSGHTRQLQPMLKRVRRRRQQSHTVPQISHLTLQAFIPCGC